MSRLLMIVSSARHIDLASEKGRKTGYSVDEVLKPYDKFLAAGVEVVAATPDGKPPHADPFTLELQFHYPDKDKDFFSQVARSFAPDLDDIRVTLHHLTELDLIAARRLFQALTVSGLDHNNAWRLVTRAALTAWREDRNFIEVLTDDPEVTDKLSSEHLQALARQVQDESVARAAYTAERLAAIETLQHPRDLSQMSDEEILSFDAVFLPGGHGAMVDLPSNTDVGRAVRLLHLREKTVATVCHGPAAFLSAGSGPDGSWLFDGYKLVSVTDEEEDQIPYGKLGMSWSLESELKNYGAVFDDGLLLHPAIAEAAVIGVPDAYLGQAIKAFVTLKPGASATPKEIMAFCKERMPRHQYPRQIEIINALPKSERGEILRAELRAQESAKLRGQR